jgi:ABC-type sugar transport system substrate-binding protein
MACGFAALVCAEQANYAVEAVKAMGWDSSPAFDGQFSPQVQAGFVDRAVQQKLDGIILVSVDVNGIKASIDRAIAAGMPILCTACVSGSYNGKGVTDVTVDFANQGEIAAWKVLADKGGDAKVVTSYDPAFSSSVDRTTGFTKVMKDNCPACSFEALKFPSVDITKPGPPQYTSMLSSNPKDKINHFQATYDGLATAAAKTNKSINRTDLTVGGYDGSPEALRAMISQNPPVEFTVAEPYTYLQWAATDLLGRMKAGVELWKGADKMPNTLITKDNAQKFLDGNPAPSAFPAPNGDWQGNFKKLWGK